MLLEKEYDKMVDGRIREILSGKDAPKSVPALAKRMRTTKVTMYRWLRKLGYDFRQRTITKRKRARSKRK